MNNWFTVYDEDGLAIRLFDTKAEALKFLQPGWSITSKALPPKKTPYELLGPALF